jgi:Xaa-Pro dipeptidase
VYSSLAQLRESIDGSIVDATDVIGFARYVKTDEQVECLRRGAAILEEAIVELTRAARPGVLESELYSRVAAKILQYGAQFQSLAFIIGPIGQGLPMRFHDASRGPRLSAGDLIDTELHLIWGGLIAQEVQPVVLGKIPVEFKPAIQLHSELYEAALAVMKPGNTFGELIDLTRGFGAGQGLASEIIMHGRGYGNDGPLMTPVDNVDSIRDIEFVKNNVFVFKPQVFSKDKRFNLIWGANVLVTDDGGQRLSQRPHGLVSLLEEGSPA